MNLGNSLKGLRKNRNLTQEDLAQYIGVSPQTVSKWENNVSMPDISLLPILADFYNITIDELLQYDCQNRRNKIKELSAQIHGLQAEGKMQEAYNVLKPQMEEWSLSVGVNSLFGSVIYQLAKKKTGDEKKALLFEAISQSEKVINLDQNETGRSIQARMLKCYCLFQLEQYKEAEAVANTLPSIYSSREMVLTRISEGEKREAYVQQAKGCLDNLAEELGE